jgi:hypothetical protein
MTVLPQLPRAVRFFACLHGLATLGFVLESLVVKENLLAGCPDKVLVTIDAPDWSILIFAMWVASKA